MSAPVKPEDLTDEMIRDLISDLETDLAIAQAALKVTRGKYAGPIRDGVCEIINARAGKER